MSVYPIAAHGVQQWDTLVENGEEVQGVELLFFGLAAVSP